MIKHVVCFGQCRFQNGNQTPGITRIYLSVAFVRRCSNLHLKIVAILSSAEVTSVNARSGRLLQLGNLLSYLDHTLGNQRHSYSQLRIGKAAYIDCTSVFAS